MRCPDCNKEVGNLASCPYCGATIDRKPQNRARDTVSIANERQINVKSLLSLGSISFGVSTACIVIWFFLTSSLCLSMMGESSIIAFHYAFTSKILATIVVGMVTAVALASLSHISMFSQKLVCIVVCVILTVIAYLILAMIGVDREGIPEYIYPLVVVGNRTLNFYLALAMPLTCGGVFISIVGRERNRAIINAFAVSAICVILSVALAYLSIGFLHLGMAGILFCIIAPVTSFIVSIFLK